jgi:hypothetical protein
MSKFDWKKRKRKQRALCGGSERMNDLNADVAMGYDAGQLRQDISVSDTHSEEPPPNVFIGLYYSEYHPNSWKIRTITTDVPPKVQWKVENRVKKSLSGGGINEILSFVESDFPFYVMDEDEKRIWRISARELIFRGEMKGVSSNKFFQDDSPDQLSDKFMLDMGFL